MSKNINNVFLTSPRLNVCGRQLYDLEMIMVGGFAPLTGFMDKEDYELVCTSMHTTDGSFFPMPIVLDVPHVCPHAVGDRVLLCDQFGNPLAVMTISSRYTPDKKAEAQHVYGTTDETHPGVWYLMHEMHDVYLGGHVERIALPARNDFRQFRHTPAELKQLFEARGWDSVVGFQTRNPMHRAHFELVRRAYEKTGAPVLVHPVVGMTKPGDIDYVTRVRTYNVVCNEYGKDFTLLSLLPLAMRMGGPREALWHALIRRNYGCTHFIVGRDHAGPGADSTGKPFYNPYQARDLADEYASEIGIEIVQSDELAYSKTRNAYITTTEITENEETEHISGTEFRRRLQQNEPIPEWFSFTESIEILREGVKRDTRPGVVLFFTGLSGAGKSTIAEVVLARLQELQDRDITFLDGDVIRQHLTKGLGFSKEDRDENVKRVGFVASEVARHGGIAICSLISPYEDTRNYVRNMVEEHGDFFEIFVDTSLEECERRDTKGLYAKARKGDIKNFTGIDDPYEQPGNPELRLTTEDTTVDELTAKIVDYLQSRGVIRNQTQD